MNHRDEHHWDIWQYNEFYLPYIEIVANETSSSKCMLEVIYGSNTQNRSL